MKFFDSVFKKIDHPTVAIYTLLIISSILASETAKLELEGIYTHSVIEPESVCLICAIIILKLKNFTAPTLELLLKTMRLFMIFFLILVIVTLFRYFMKI